MSYDLLRGLYLGATSNADTTSAISRRLLHVRTELDALVPKLVGAGYDLVVTGNPGDGKSHLIRTLADRDRLHGAELEMDLSAVDEADVLARWRAARSAGRPFVLCGNQGPLNALLPALRGDPLLSDAGGDLTRQIGRMVAALPEDLPARPTRAHLLDLADRSVLSPALIEGALRAICLRVFFPEHPRAHEMSAGQNLSLLSTSVDAAPRLAALLSIAGRRCPEHVGFRHLWAAISFSICGGKALSTLQQELSRSDGLIRSSPLDNLARGTGQGALLKAFRDFADPASWPSPKLDEDLWSNGAPSNGSWDVDLDGAFEAPSALWARGDRAEALEHLRSIKRIVALFHSAGEGLVEAISAPGREMPTSQPDDALLDGLLLGLRRLYLDEAEESAAPAWLRDGLPLWVSHTYEDVAADHRPHAAVACAPREAFEVRRASRPGWIGGALGPAPDLVWLAHAASGVALRVDPELYGHLRRATDAPGPAGVPDGVQRFLARLSGWEEGRSGGRADRVAVIDRPRGGLIAAASLRHEPGGASYGAPDAR